MDGALPRAAFIELVRRASEAPLPAPLRQAGLRAIAGRVLRANPALAERLAELGVRRLLIDPSDLPLSFVITLRHGAVDIACRDGAAQAVDASVAGPLALLLDLAEGRLDGDALFFNRALRISGDTELVLAVRNALDGAGLDLMQALLASLPPPAARLARAALAGAQHLAARSRGLVETINAPVLARLARQEAWLEALASDVAALSAQRRAPAAARGPR